MKKRKGDFGDVAVAFYGSCCGFSLIVPKRSTTLNVGCIGSNSG